MSFCYTYWMNEPINDLIKKLSSVSGDYYEEGQLVHALTSANPPDLFEGVRPALNERARVSYQGPWYHQGGEPTCSAWAVANGALVLGAEPNIDFIKLLSARARELAAQNKGLSNTEIAQMLNTNQNYSLIRVGDLTSDRESETIFSPIKSILRIRRVMAERLLPILDDKKPLLVTINSSAFFFGKDIVPNHTLVIAGYRQLGNRIDFQIIDSNYGIYWAPDENLKVSILPNTIYEMSLPKGKK